MPDKFVLFGAGKRLSQIFITETNSNSETGASSRREPEIIIRDHKPDECECTYPKGVTYPLRSSSEIISPMKSSICVRAIVE